MAQPPTYGEAMNTTVESELDRNVQKQDQTINEADVQLEMQPLTITGYDASHQSNLMCEKSEQAPFVMSFQLGQDPSFTSQVNPSAPLIRSQLAQVPPIMSNQPQIPAMMPNQPVPLHEGAPMMVPHPPQVSPLMSPQITSPLLFSNPQFGRSPAQNIVCGFCYRMNKCTITREKISSIAYFWGCLLCFFASPVCSWIPCALSEMKVTDHYCGYCNKKIGRYTPKQSRAVIILTSLLIIGIGLEASFLLWVTGILNS